MVSRRGGVVRMDVALLLGKQRNKEKLRGVFGRT
jgi:hypothetical protein